MDSTGDIGDWMSKEEAIKELTKAYRQQRDRRPMRDDEPIAVYYGDLRKLVED